MSDYLSLHDYYNTLECEIKEIYREINITDCSSYDILNTYKALELDKDAKKKKIIDMFKGKVWQTAIGVFPGFKDLKQGDSTGLDLINHDRKVVIEVKNRTNTMNKGSRKSSLGDLADYKKQYPEYTCILGQINCYTEKLFNKESNYKKIIHNGCEIIEYKGKDFLRYIFREHTDDILNFIIKITKPLIDKLIDDSSINIPMSSPINIPTPIQPPPQNVPQRVECPCGGHYGPRGKRTHEKSKMHINFLSGRT